jgi:hypothetical protein
MRGAALRVKGERPLRSLPPCRAYLNTYRKTRDLTARLGSGDMPPELQSRLRDFLRARILSGEI